MFFSSIDCMFHAWFLFDWLIESCRLANHCQRKGKNRALDVFVILFLRDYFLPGSLSCSHNSRAQGGIGLNVEELTTMVSNQVGANSNACPQQCSPWYTAPVHP